MKKIFIFSVFFVAFSCNKVIQFDFIQPSITTTSVLNVTNETIKIGGEITDDGGEKIISKGVCWSISQNPTINDNHTNDGIGIASFTSLVDGLNTNTIYYVRAYATNIIGTSYGNELSILTAPFPGSIINVDGGSFEMGSFGTETNESPVHSVNIDSFRMSEYEITNLQFANFLNEIDIDQNGSLGGVTYIDIAADACKVDYSSGQFIAESSKVDHPVVTVTWEGANAYCEHYGGRLPTEAEWEYAARGGILETNTNFSGSNISSDVAWYVANSDLEIHPVARKQSNEIGLYDMSGNVLEWCSDWYDSSYYSDSEINNPQGPEIGTEHILRGGSFNSQETFCRVAIRFHSIPTYSSDSSGFRPVF